MVKKIKVKSKFLCAVDGEQPCDGRVAALLAVHLVSQVIDEASVIANAASETGEIFNHTHHRKTHDS